MEGIDPELALLLFARVLPTSLLLGRLSRGIVGWTAALSLGLALAWGLSPGHVDPAARPALGAVSLSFALIRELCLGGIVGLAVLLPIAALGWTPRFAELSLGGPALGRSGPISALFGLLSLFVALTLGAHRSLAIALHESLLTAPLLGAVFDARAFALGVAQLVSQAFGLALAIGLPLLLSLLVAEASLAALLRLFGRVGESAGASLFMAPLFVLLSAVLALPLVSRMPEALRVSLRLLRELVADIAS